MWSQFNGKRFMALFALAAVLVAALAAARADAASVLLGGGKKNSVNSALGHPDNPVDIETEDGLHIVYKGTFRWEKNGKPANFVRSVFIVTPQQDTSLKINTSEIFDNRSNKFDRESGWGFIANNEVGSRPREIMEGAQTIVQFDHAVSSSYGTPTFARMRFWFNDKELVFRNVQTQSYEAWKEVSETLYDD